MPEPALAPLSAALNLSAPPAIQHMRTICEVLRELGRMAEARSDTASLVLILEATHMAKRMQRKLVAYNADERGAL